MISAGCGQAHGRAPVSGAAADVDLRVAVAMQARRRSPAAAERGSRTARSGRRACARRSAARRRTAPPRTSSAAGAPAARARASCRARRARAPSPLPASARRSDGRCDRRCRPGRSSASPSPIETRSLPSTRMPKRAKLVQPRFGAREIFVIAGNEEDAVARAQVGQRRDRVAQVARRCRRPDRP